jgi:hypothetical protein
LRGNDAHLDTLAIDPLKIRGQKTLLAPNPEQPFRRAVQPGHQPGHRPERQRDGDQRHGEREAKVGQEAAEGLHQVGRETDLV